MQADLGLEESFAFGQDECFPYLWPSSMAGDCPEDSSFDFSILQEHLNLDEFDLDQSETPSTSASPTSENSATESALVESSSSEASYTSKRRSTIQLTWPAEGQLQSPAQHSRTFSSPVIRDTSFLPPKAGLSQGSPSSEPHHEGSCMKCKMTEAEARKCRLERRREQNRASQRKFRARKEAKIREAASQVASLESYVDFLEKHNGDLESANAELRQQVANFESNKISRSAPSMNRFPKLQQATVGKPSKVFQNLRTPLSTQQGSDLHLSLIDHDLVPPHQGLNLN